MLNPLEFLEFLDFLAGGVLGIMGLLLFIVGARVKRDFRGRPHNRWYCRALMAHGVFTYALAVYLLLRPLDVPFPYSTATDSPLVFVGLIAMGITVYCILRYAIEAHPTIRSDGPHGFRGE